MAVSYPISLTATGVRRVRIRQRSVVSVSESPYTLAQQVQVHQGQGWMLEFEYRVYSRAAAEAIIAQLVSLNGREGTFLFGDTANTSPRGVGTGTPLVKGGSQTGYDLITDGWTAGQTGILKAGDWIQLGTGSSSRLHKVMADANSNGSGEATLTLWPRLRSSPADNAALTVTSPKGLWRLTTDGFGWDIDWRKLYEGLTVTATEALEL